VSTISLPGYRDIYRHF